MPRSAEQANYRRSVLEQMLRGGQRIRNAEMARRFGVAEMTIRRDLEALAAAGVAVRNYGGAQALGRVTFEFAFSDRNRLNSPAKRRIGAAAARRISPGQIVLIDTGTTTLEIARALSGRRIPCTIVTSSLVIAGELWSRPGVELVLLGGRVRNGSPDLVGEGTLADIRLVKADLAFLGVDAMDEGGCFAADADVAQVAGVMLRQARRVIVVADASKLGRREPARYARWHQVDELITDRRAQPSMLAAIQAAGVKVTVV